ncbi:MAG: hypothetical protein UT43_C0002G0010 [Parcubacteria group bacterium GW2011_GWC1_39_29]|nr:MAG: hypothetical protein UT43_C0002G0010 [Parcubacteria group bacterium GW2011_GWC1_39_29]
MEIDIAKISEEQLSSGQIRSFVINDDEQWKREVFCMTPTYLVVALLRLQRSLGLLKGIRVDEIITKGTKFLVDNLFRDPITGISVCHFNSFYPPDWENTLMVTLLGWEEGLINKDDLLPLRDLLRNNCSSRGVGVWIKDPYSKDNNVNNVFDLVVSRVVSRWLRLIWDEKWSEVEAMSVSGASLYYHPSLQKILIDLLDKDETKVLKDYEYIDSRLFHHGNRKHIWYAAPAVIDILTQGV